MNSQAQMDGGFRLDDEHRYWLGKKRLFGVTEVIKSNGVMSGGDFYTELGREKGEAIHRACQLLFLDKLDWSTIDGRILGYVLSCTEYIAHSKFKPRRTEHSNYHPELGYGGTWDADGSSIQIDDFLFDLKSGKKEKWHGVQTSAYQELARVNGILIKRRGALYLQPDGSMAKLYLHEDRNDFKIFLSALRILQKEEQTQMELEPYRQNIKRWMDAA
jgi:hypothetical protein